MSMVESTEVRLIVRINTELCCIDELRYALEGFQDAHGAEVVITEIALDDTEDETDG